MKILATILLIGTSFITRIVTAQPSDVHAEAMSIFRNWTGHWHGTGTMRRGPGEAQAADVDERIEYKLDNTIVVIEGIGKKLDPVSKKESTVHHAYAVISYDAASREYKIHTYLHDGRSSAGWLKVLGENQYQWGFEVPGGNIRYSITIDPNKKVWTEVGEFSQDNTMWHEFFSMKLEKAE